MLTKTDGSAQHMGWRRRKSPWRWSRQAAKRLMAVKQVLRVVVGHVGGDKLPEAAGRLRNLWVAGAFEWRARSWLARLAKAG